LEFIERFSISSLKLNAFPEVPADHKTCFENAPQIFEAIYWKDYEFTKYYFEENLKLLTSHHPRLRQ
jgi:hypothetical protein